MKAQCASENLSLYFHTDTEKERGEKNLFLIFYCCFLISNKKSNFLRVNLPSKIFFSKKMFFALAFFV